MESDHGLRAGGVVWYRQADWLRLRMLFPDANKLPDTYAEWLASAESLMAQLKRDGIAADTKSAWTLPCSAGVILVRKDNGGSDHPDLV